MVLARLILKRLLAHESLMNNLQFGQVVRFLDFTNRVWDEIVLPDQYHPLELPAHIVQLLGAILNLDPSLIQLMWSAFVDIAEASHQEREGLEPSLDDAFRIHAHSHQIGL
ncbi:hypothetical protein B0H14DRAFT_2639710 [Mycena olivaceomarginata]|nr:hypothetical protein B0H14DRAFT_2639710 [Mycena olivaceomarginata]